MRTASSRHTGKTYRTHLLPGSRRCGQTTRLLIWAGLVCATAIAWMPLSHAAQATVDPPGSRQPSPPATSRVAPLPESEWTDVHRQLVDKFSSYGPPDNLFKTLLRLPEMVDGALPFTTYLSEDSSLTPRHRELLILRTTWLHGSPALWARHAGRGAKAGLSAAEIRRVAEGPDTAGWDPFEATLLRLADQLYRNSSVTDATWKALSAGYDLFHAMDAVETVNHYTFLSLLANSLGVQPDPATRDRLPKDVPYRVTVPPREPPLSVARIVPPEGRGIAVGRTFNMYPQLSQRWSPRQSFINRVSKLTPRHREMLILRMGWNSRSEYEWAQHVGRVGRAREHGLEPERIAEGPAAAGWSPLEKAILQTADDLYRDGVVSDATWRRLSQDFDQGLVMSAIFTPSGYRAISMSLNAYGVQLEPGDERFPQVPRR
jgi:4-carboxymuconolactone decarboxylase